MLGLQLQVGTAQGIVRISKRTAKPIICCFMGVIDGLFEWDFEMDDVLAWRYTDDLETEIPLSISEQ